MANPVRYAKDLLADGDLRFISRTFPLWVAVGMAVPFGLGVALTGSLAGGLTGLLWGGAVRVFLLHHVTFSINSLCHCFGRRPFDTGDESRNLAWLAPLAFGEAWHNNHHAFPSSARHGLGRRQLDPGAWVITGLERVRLACDVVRITPARQQAKRGSSG
jgi:stearoyl-CoA desaturase (delta-9 desaturase)